MTCFTFAAEASGVDSGLIAPHGTNGGSAWGKRPARGRQCGDAHRVLKHDQSRPLGELNAQFERQGSYKAFPQARIEVVGWYVMMGIGQMVTLQLRASRLCEVNRLFENMAGGADRTEFYPTYD